MSVLSAAIAAPDYILRVGVAVDNAPWFFRNPQGQQAGFEADLLKRIGLGLDMRVDIYEMPLENLFSALSAGQIDAAAGSITVTGDRRARFAFTQPYYDTNQGLAVIKSAKVRGLSDMSGKTVGFEAGSTNETWAIANKGKLRFAELRPVQGAKTAFAKLSSGEIDGYIGDLPALLYALLWRSDLAVVARIPTNEQYAMVFPKGSPLVDRANEIISRMKQDGEMARIHQKWFGAPPAAGSSTARVLPRP